MNNVNIMKKNRILIFLIVFFVLTSFVLADVQSLKPIKKGECINLIQSCASCSYINFTSILYPNSRTALANVEASKDGSIFNYTFCNTNSTGKYIVYGVGDVDGIDTVFAYDFEVSSSGIERTNNAAAVMVPIFSLIINFLVFLLAFKKVIVLNQYVNFVLKRSLIVFGLWLLTLNSVIMASVAEYVGLNLTTEMFMFMNIFGWAAYISMIILVFTTVVQTFNEYKINKSNERTGGDMDG